MNTMNTMNTMKAVRHIDFYFGDSSSALTPEVTQKWRPPLPGSLHAG